MHWQRQTLTVYPIFSRNFSVSDIKSIFPPDARIARIFSIVAALDSKEFKWIIASWYDLVDIWNCLFSVDDNQRLDEWRETACT